MFKGHGLLHLLLSHSLRRGSTKTCFLQVNFRSKANLWLKHLLLYTFFIYLETITRLAPHRYLYNQNSYLAQVSVNVYIFCQWEITGLTPCRYILGAKLPVPLVSALVYNLYSERITILAPCRYILGAWLICSCPYSLFGGNNKNRNSSMTNFLS